MFLTYWFEQNSLGVPDFFDIKQMSNNTKKLSLCLFNSTSTTEQITQRQMIG
jgi:hypothetical protein